MALWGKTDTLAAAPKWLETAAANTNKSNDMDNAVFVDLTEAAVAGNRAKQERAVELVNENFNKNKT